MKGCRKNGVIVELRAVIYGWYGGSLTQSNIQ